MRILASPEGHFSKSDTEPNLHKSPKIAQRVLGELLALDEARNGVGVVRVVSAAKAP